MGAAALAVQADLSDLDDWQSMFSVTVFGMLAVTQAVLPGMVERGSGAIVGVMGDSGLLASPLCRRQRWLRDVLNGDVLNGDVLNGDVIFSAFPNTGSG